MSEKLGKRMRGLRKEQGLTQDQLADALGITKSTIAKYESGRLYPSLNILMGAADYFDVSLDYLAGRSKIRKKDPDWFDNLPPELQKLVQEKNLEYLEISLMAEEKGWTKEAIEEVMEVIEHYSKKGRQN